MKGIDFLNTFTDDASSVLKQFLELNPYGTLVVSDNFEIVYLNNALKECFEGDLALTEKYVGNLLRCKYVEEDHSQCGTKQQCSSCTMRKSARDAFESNKVIRNVQVSNEVVINGNIKVKWFDMTFAPLEIKDKKYLWISLIDLTDLMQYKIDFELGEISNDEDHAIEKDQFHETVIGILGDESFHGEAFLVMIELKHSHAVKENFGNLWRNDYLSSFHHYLRNFVDQFDQVCRYSLDHFLVFLSYKNHEECKNFLDQIKRFEYSHFYATDTLAIKGISIKARAEKKEQSSESNQLYIEYFKALTLLEKLSEGECTEFQL